MPHSSSAPAPSVSVASALEILSNQAELREMAVRCVGDVNEARMLVHTVMSHAFAQYRTPAGATLPRDLGERMRREIKALAGRGRTIAPDACGVGA